LVCSPATQTCELHAHGVDIDAAVMGPGNAEHVQQQVRQVTSAASLSMTLSTTPAPGHMLVMIGGAWASPLGSVAGGGVAAWALAARSGDNTNAELWYGISDGSSPTITIDAAVAGKMSMAVIEWSGLAATNVLDVAHAGSGWSATVSAGPIVTTNAHDLLIFGLTDYSSMSFDGPTPGAWDKLEGSTAVYPQLEWMTTTTVAGTYDPQLTGSGQGWDAVVAAFRIGT
jgi:hypothetical protein